MHPLALNPLPLPISKINSAQSFCCAQAFPFPPECACTPTAHLRGGRQQAVVVLHNSGKGHPPGGALAFCQSALRAPTTGRASPLILALCSGARCVTAQNSAEDLWGLCSATCVLTRYRAADASACVRLMHIQAERSCWQNGFAKVHAPRHPGKKTCN